MKILIILFIIFDLLCIIESLKYGKLNSPFPYYYGNRGREIRRVKEEEFLKVFKEYVQPPPVPSYEIYYFNQTIDHFNFQNQGKFLQRYIVSDVYWSKPTNNSFCNSPILFYSGNEGDIELFYENSQFITNILAPQFNGLLLFAEHRYYSESLPFGNSSFTTENMEYLTIEQALADYAELIQSVLTDLDALHCPVITIGGSYGGMLSAYFRMKYPNIVDAALAASAPILFFPGTGIDYEGYDEDATKDYTETSMEGTCTETLRSAINEINNIGNSNPSELIEIQESLRLCGVDNTLDDIISWIENGICFMAMGDYTSPANFLEPLPANPVNESCSLLSQQTNNIQGLYQVLNQYFNYTGSVKCFNTSIASDSLNENGWIAWDYQSCTELVLPVESDNIHDMFPVNAFSIEEYTQYCQDTWNVTPDPYWMATFYGGRNFTATNIIFSTGVRDPWHSGCVTYEKGENSLYSIVIQGAAHHQDLRYPEPTDSISLQEARKLEIEIIQSWINEASIKKSI